MVLLLLMVYLSTVISLHCEYKKINIAIGTMIIAEEQ